MAGLLLLGFIVLGGLVIGVCKWYELTKDLP